MSSYNFIIAGGGVAGVVLASRLRSSLPSSVSILLLEAGPDASSNPLVREIKNAFNVIGSELDWSYKTAPQKHLGNRVCEQIAGKALGGGSAINYFGWVRGDKNDNDAWAKIVGDERWSYAGFLPYFKKTEHYHTTDLDASQHGYDGPLYTQSVASSGRSYPLTENVKRSWEELGLERVMDANAGNPMGIAMVTENLRDGKRQIASDVYSLEGVTVLTGAMVASVILEGKKAVGVKLVDGRVFEASEEVLLSAGAIATPQILLLSGIGAKEDLQEHDIEQLVDAPDLREPEKGLAVGSPNFNYQSLEKGFPGDWCITQTMPHEGLKAALAKDEQNVTDLHPLLSPPRSHTESFLLYVAGNKANPVVPADGSHVTTTVMAMLPTSRGAVTLASKDPAMPPRIDPNYYATEADRYVVRTALRKIMQVMMETKEGKAMVKEQAVTKGRSPLSPRSTDEEIDELVRERGSGISHTAGTASMGTVVDGNLRVNGVQGLRVIDASVIPVPLASHLQACIYALAEQAAEIIVQGREK